MSQDDINDPDNLSSMASVDETTSGSVREEEANRNAEELNVNLDTSDQQNSAQNLRANSNDDPLLENIEEELNSSVESSSDSDERFVNAVESDAAEDLTDEEFDLAEDDQPEEFQNDEELEVDEEENVDVVEHELNFRPNIPRYIRFRNMMLQRLHGRAQPHGQGNRDFGQWRNWVLRRFQHRESHDSDEDDDSDSLDTTEIPQNITFDKNLPTSHSYLGAMEECSGVAYQDRDTFQTLQILCVTDFVLIPGQTVPMQLSHLREASMIRRVMTQPDKTFGVLYKNYFVSEENSQVQNLHNFGCTAEIRSFQDKEEHGVSILRIVVVGRQKFKVMEKRSQIDGNVLAKVKIMEDVILPDINRSVGISSKCRLLHSQPSNDGSASFQSNAELLGNKHRRKWAATRYTAWSTQWPPWVFKMYDVEHLRLQIFNEMREWNQKLEECQCPQGATDFSYWVITNFPLSDVWRLRLLQLNSAVQRLRCELSLLQKCTVLTCSDCSLHIANRRDVFSMSASGPMAAYVNPGGAVHETLTLYKATGLGLIGRKSTEHSWFPGYAWTICECRRCGRHMGWKFTATRSNLTPQKFWGLTRSALSPKISGLDIDDSDEDSVDANEENVEFETQLIPML